MVLHQKLLKLGEVGTTHKVLQHQQVLFNSDEKQKNIYITHSLNGPSVKGRWIGAKAEVSEWLTNVQKEWLVFVCLSICM